jgi:hypothetical protein
MPAAEAPTITYFAILGFHLFEINAWFGQLATQAGSSSPWQRSHLATDFAFLIHLDGAVWADHYAGPATDALFFVVGDFDLFFRLFHGA